MEDGRSRVAAEEVSGHRLRIPEEEGEFHDEAAGLIAEQHPGRTGSRTTIPGHAPGSLPGRVNRPAWQLQERLPGIGAAVLLRMPRHKKKTRRGGSSLYLRSK